MRTFTLHSGTGVNVLALPERDVDVSVHQNPFTGDYYDRMEHLGITNNAEMTKAPQEMGHDGIRYVHDAPEGKKRYGWTAFRPEQIKSAISNTGAFDPTNPDIRYAAEAPTFYSEMARFIDAKGPGKNTAAQWKVLLDGWAKAGKFKGEELEWSGVKEWLDLESQPRLKPAIKIIGGVDDGKILTNEKAVIHAQIHYRASDHKGIKTTDLGFVDLAGLYHTKVEVGMDASQLSALKPTITKDQVLGFVRENGVRVEETMLTDLDARKAALIDEIDRLREERQRKTHSRTR